MHMEQVDDRPSTPVKIIRNLATKQRFLETEKGHRKWEYGITDSTITASLLKSNRIYFSNLIRVFVAVISNKL